MTERKQPKRRKKTRASPRSEYPDREGLEQIRGRAQAVSSGLQWKDRSLAGGRDIPGTVRCNRTVKDLLRKSVAYWKKVGRLKTRKGERAAKQRL